jgi:hypothetical protein
MQTEYDYDLERNARPYNPFNYVRGCGALVLTIAASIAGAWWLS